MGVRFTRVIVAAILFAAVAAPPGPAPAEEAASYRLWLGDTFLRELPPPRPGALLDPPEAMDWPAADPRAELVILTTAEIVTSSQLLPDFVTFRAAEGWEVRLVTEDEWDLPTGVSGDETADRIRAFLVDEYTDSPGAYLLLIGDPHPDEGDVPMKWVRPLIDVVHWYPEWLADELDPVPTDFYYADLDGDWDCDGDGQYGEYPDDDGPGCVDFGPELYVGRLPVYGGSGELLDELLARALERDLEEDKSYRRDVLLPAALFGLAGAPAPSGDAYPEHDDGACIAHTVHRDLPDEFQAGATRLFEDEGVVTSPYPHEGPLDRDEVIAEWSTGRGIVLWCGHGSPGGVYRTVWSADLDGDELADEDECSYPAFLQSHDADDLEDVPGAFTFHVSCDNGFPEVQDNIGTALLLGGAAATATASRPAFGVTVGYGEVWEPRPELATSSTAGYFYAMQIADGATAGEALAYTKYALPGDGWVEEGSDFTGAAWITRVEYNLYGDPTRSLELCESSEDCDDGSPCNGTETCEDGFCVHHDVPDCSLLDDACNIGRCQLDSGECAAEPRADGWACDDELWCTEDDICLTGTCSGEERDCGEREGFEFYCNEELDHCDWEKAELTDDEDDDGCQCELDGGHPGEDLAGTPMGDAVAAGAIALAVALRRARRRESR